MKKEESYVKVYTALDGLISLADDTTNGVKVLTQLNEKHANYSIEVLIPTTWIDHDADEDDFLRLK